MCPPALTAAQMFMASLAVSAVTAGVQYIGQQNMAEAQYEAQVNNANAVRENAIADMVAKGNDLNARQQQETASTALNINNNKLRAERAKATATASSESAGLSFEALLADYDQQYMGYADSQMQQLGFNTEQIQRNRESIEAQAKSRINGVPLTPIAQPSLGGAILGVAGAGMDAYSKYAVRDPNTGGLTLS